MSFYIVKGDILEQNVDAIVIAVAPHLKLDEGYLQSKVKKTCGKKLVFEMQQLKNINISECVITNAYNLPCKKIIFAASPKWNGGDDNEEENLENTYINCLDLAVAFGLESVYFPLLSAGSYEMPKRKAIDIAIRTITDYIQDVDINVGLVIYDKSTYNTYKDMFKGYEIKGGKLSERTKEMLECQRKEQGRFGWYKKGTAEILDNGPEAKEFSAKLTYFMTQKGLSKLDCYNGVVSKTMFNNFLNGSIPKKYTVIALGINMGLDLWEIIDLLRTIDESMDERIDKDQIIINGIYDDKELEEINEDLVSMNCSPLPTNNPSI